MDNNYSRMLWILCKTKPLKHATLPYVIGTILGFAVFPGIIWVIRFFIGKELKK